MAGICGVGWRLLASRRGRESVELQLELRLRIPLGACELCLDAGPSISSEESWDLQRIVLFRGTGMGTGALGWTQFFELSGWGLVRRRELQGEDTTESGRKQQCRMD